MEESLVNMQQVCQEEVIDRLMQSYGQDILQLVYTYVREHSLAEDLTQEIFMKCYKAYPKFNGNSSIKTWVWRIAVNHTKDYLKSWYARQVRVTDTKRLHAIDSQQEVEQAVIQHDEDAALADVVMQLPMKYREVIYLYYFEEYTIKEIASILRANENTVKTRLRKGKALLKKRLEALRWTTD